MTLAGKSTADQLRSSTGLSISRYAASSLRYHWRVNGAILLGIVVGTAVLTGALVVGDSVRFSLRRLTLERLGRIDQVLLSNHFFSPSLANLQLEGQPIGPLASSQPAILISQSAAENQNADPERRAGEVLVLGVGAQFWDLGTAGRAPKRHPQRGEIVLNQPLANKLQASIGDRVVVRLPKTTQIAGDSPLSDKTDRVESLAELKVIDILPAEGLGRFALSANQALPRTAYVALPTIQSALNVSGKINAVLVARDAAHSAMSRPAIGPTENRQLHERVRPDLTDAGLHFEPVELTYLDEATQQQVTTFRYASLSTNAMLFTEQAEQAVVEALGDLTYQRVLTYLANGIQKAGTDDSTLIPYSTVSAVEDSSLSPLQEITDSSFRSLQDDSIVLNEWAAADLNASVGDIIRLTYFAPETTHGKVQTRTASFPLQAILPLTDPLLPFEASSAARYVEPPSRGNDPNLTPAVPGITDQASIDDWDPPFPFDYSRIRDKDETYWERHRTTPKAFVSLAAGQDLWGSRFGDITSFRIESESTDRDSAIRRRIRQAVQANLGAFGFRWLRLRRDGLRASKGTTPFNVLFLGFSSFIIGSAVMLVSLLFRLGLEQRAAEAGLLLAAGLNAKLVFRLFLMQGMALAACGALLGVALGIVYAAIMIFGLRTWWIQAVVTPFLQLQVEPVTLLVGWLVGAGICFWTIRRAIARFTTLPVRSLLTHQLERLPRSGGKRIWARSVIVALWMLAGISSIAAVFLSGESQAGAFFAGGASVLGALLLQVSRFLRRPETAVHVRDFSFSLHQLIVRNIGRNPSRSVLTIGLMATASFLIVAISAFRLAPTDAGTGGFELMGQFEIPIFDNLNDPRVRRDLLGSEAERLAGHSVLVLRMVAGDDASCRNLYQAQSPRIIGVSDTFVEHFDQNDTAFSWANSAADNPQQRDNPWHLVTQPTSDDVIPVIIDKNTATYSLQLYGGVGEEFELTYDQVGKLRFRVVGLLANSVLQGSLLVSEEQLVRHFPTVSGYRFCLVSCDADQTSQVQSMLEDYFSDQGLMLQNSRHVLRDLLAVQNTYLSTFQSLGGLGLLLGTLGIVAVQLRSVFERRKELALLRAAGFSRHRLNGLVLLEHLTLLLSGLSIGVFAALVTVLPHAWTTDVRTPWDTLLTVLVAIVSVGLVTGYAALRPAARAPLVSALRGD